MRLDRNKIVYDSEKTFGELLFMEFNEEHFERDEDGKDTAELARRSYNLYSIRQGEIIRVNLPAEVPLKEFKEEERVELIDVAIAPLVDNGYGNERTYFITAADMVRAGEKPKALAAQKPQENKQ